MAADDYEDILTYVGAFYGCTGYGMNIQVDA